MSGIVVKCTIPRPIPTPIPTELVAYVNVDDPVCRKDCRGWEGHGDHRQLRWRWFLKICTRSIIETSENEKVSKSGPWTQRTFHSLTSDPELLSMARVKLVFGLIRN